MPRDYKNHQKDPVEIEAEYVHETDNAVLVDIGNEDSQWVPKSLLTDFQGYTHAEGDMIEIYVEEWFAKKNDMI